MVHFLRYVPQCIRPIFAFRFSIDSFSSLSETISLKRMWWISFEQTLLLSMNLDWFCALVWQLPLWWGRRKDFTLHHQEIAKNQLVCLITHQLKFHLISRNSAKSLRFIFLTRSFCFPLKIFLFLFLWNSMEVQNFMKQQI